jgi:hypothetical protein
MAPSKPASKDGESAKRRKGGVEQHLRRIAEGRVLSPRRRVLEVYKEKILELAGSGESLRKIVEYLVSNHQMTVHHNTISNRLKEWGHKLKERNLPFKGKMRKLNLDPFKDQLQKWEKEGITPSDMVDLFEQAFNACTSKRTIERYLHDWRSPAVTPPWRETESRSSLSLLPIPTLLADLLSGEELRVLRDGIRTAYLEVTESLYDTETMTVSENPSLTSRALSPNTNKWNEDTD